MKTQFMKTTDGFEFRTVRKGRRTTCFCRKRGYEVRVSIVPGPDRPPDAIPLEHLELSARNLWIAARHMRRTGLLERIVEYRLRRGDTGPRPGRRGDGAKPRS